MEPVPHDRLGRTSKRCNDSRNSFDRLGEAFVTFPFEIFFFSMSQEEASLVVVMSRESTSG